MGNEKYWKSEIWLNELWFFGKEIGKSSAGYSRNVGYKISRKMSFHAMEINKIHY